MASRAAEKQNKAEGVRQFYKQVTPTEFCSAAALAFRLRVINSSTLLNVSGALIWAVVCNGFTVLHDGTLFDSRS